MRDRLVGVVICMALTTQATAQDIPPALDPTTMIGFAGTVAADQHARRTFGSRIASRSAIRASSARPAGVANLRYRPSPAVRQKVQARAVAQLQRSSPEEAAKLRNLLSSGQVRREVATYLSRYGMSVDSLVDTTTLYLAMSWYAVRANSGDPTRAQMLGLRNQVAETMAATPEFTRASDAVKQEIVEANIIQASFSSALANAAARDRKLAPMVRNSVGKGVMSTYQMNLLDLDLSSRGLR